MDRTREARLARRRRRIRRRNLTILGLVLVLAALVLLLIFGPKGCTGKEPASSGTTGQTETARTDPARTTEKPGTTEAPVSTQGDTPVPSSEEVPTRETAVSTAPETEPAPPETEAPQPPEDESWKLILVNADHPIPEDFTVTLKELRNGHHVDERIYPELQQMFDDARAQGIYPFINESFRTAERQQEILDKYIAKYEAAGMSRTEAEKAARQVVALPGTSEHQLGLALDLIAEYDADSTATWNWLKENCWRYGFILRYPADKVAITGISNEPWHFRYVGQPAAQEITERGLCLEEYLEQLEERP